MIRGLIAVPDTRQHRGPHPDDVNLFDAAAVPVLRQAVLHAAWLLTRGYPQNSVTKLVGDRFQLTQRQRIALMRSCCSDQALSRRLERQVPADQLAGAFLLLDGFNVLTTIEAALGGGVILEGRDGCFRDMASMHGSYRKVAETRPALVLIGEMLGRARVDSCRWYLDSPVSNSGRLKTLMHQAAAEHGWNWHVELLPNPDSVLIGADQIIVSADSAVLDQCQRWFNLARQVIVERIPSAHIVGLA